MSLLLYIGLLSTLDSLTHKPDMNSVILLGRRFLQCGVPGWEGVGGGKELPYKKDRGDHQKF